MNYFPKLYKQRTGENPQVQLNGKWIYTDEYVQWLEDLLQNAGEELTELKGMYEYE